LTPDFRARVSDRRLLSALLLASGVSEEKLMAAFGIVDKLERADPAHSLQRFQNECDLDEVCARKVLSLFKAGSLEEVAGLFPEDPAVTEAIETLQEYKGILESLGLGEYLDFDLRIVRGLAYYTGIVFELFDRRGEFRAICGGGRYDRLLELVGGDPLPAVGFGMGDVVLSALLEDRGLLPATEREADLYLVTIVPELRPLAYELARAHREQGRRVIYALRGQSVKKQFSAAAVEGARSVVVLGPSEVERGLAMVREMASGVEREVSLEVLRQGGGLGGEEG
jgi:histidyl-tRNA synthetase